MTNIAIEIPQRSDYGAVEIKAYINKSTIRGFLVALSILLLILIAYFAKDFVGSTKPKMKAPIVKIDVVDIPPPTDEVEAAPPPEVQVVNNSVARAGTPNPVPDSEILADAPDYASMMDQSVSDAKGGGAGNLDLTTFNFDEGNNNSNVQVREQEADPDDFVAVEKEVGFSYDDLQKIVEYPETARRAGIEGQVIVQAYIGKDGKVKKTQIKHSDNKYLNEAAEGAVKRFDAFTPAIQNKQPVAVWISIPIKFKIK